MGRTKLTTWTRQTFRNRSSLRALCDSPTCRLDPLLALEFHAVTQHLVNAPQEHPRDHQPAHLVATPLGHPLVARLVTRQLTRPHRRLDQVVPQVAIRAAAAQVSVPTSRIRLLNSRGQPGEAD